MWNWIMFNEKGETFHLLKDAGKGNRYGQRAFILIQEDMIDTFGISDDYQKQLELRIRIERMYLKMMETGDKTMSLLIKVEENELKLLENAPTKGDLHESLLQIEKLQGVRYDPKQLTVYEFYKLAKLVGNNKPSK